MLEQIGLARQGDSLAHLGATPEAGTADMAVAAAGIGCRQRSVFEIAFVSP
jgi:Flp pilus assembly CpaE family ATPase